MPVLVDDERKNENQPSIIPSNSLFVPPAPTVRPESHFREFGDHKKTRQLIYDNVLNAAKNLPSLTNKQHTLSLSNVAYEPRDSWTVDERKKALLNGGTLARRLYGTWELSDNASGKVIAKKKGVVARVPYLTDLGTFINGGSDYTLINQQRLRSGVFARQKENGELESHFNILPGNGISHRYLLDPAKGVFKIHVGQAEMPVLPLLRAMGATDRELRDAWGNELFQINQAKDEGGVLNKLEDRILRKDDRDNPDESYRRQKLVDTFHSMQLDPEVTRHTLKYPHTHIDRHVILKATKKLLEINQGKNTVDDRDHLGFQVFVGPEDLFAERIKNDHSKLRRKLFTQASLKGTLENFPSSAMTPQLEQVLLGSGLAMPLEEINTAEILDKQSRMTRLGEGGLSSIESIPEEARGVNPSSPFFIDPVRTSESLRVGIDVNVASNARKGADGRIYTQFQDARTGKNVWKSPQDLHDAAIAFPDSFDTTAKRVKVAKGGTIDYVKPNEVDYIMPHFEGAFSSLGNLVPLKSGSKAQRMAMASRMLTQALPLQNAEAPLVQAAMPGTNSTKSYEEHYGTQMGAIRAPNDGRVVAMNKSGIKVKYDDGHTEVHELYDNYPFNRKTSVTQTPTVQYGDKVKKGQLLARSNYTDERGTTALGTNLYTAYIPWKGYNFQDATVISESAARDKLRSEHMYQHDVQLDRKHKMGKRNYVSLFPGRFDKATLEMLDENGIVKPGTTVEYDQPLILAAHERDRAENKIHKKRQAGYDDQTVIWKHHDPGIVTDVSVGPNGPVVFVKSVSPMQVGDKISGRYGDKNIVSAIIPDSQMPHDSAGRPFEILQNPNGIVSRTNPSQKVELWLGKVARQTGKPFKVEDFNQIKDLVAYAQMHLRQHGISPYDDIIDPTTNTKIPKIATGHRFYMKLHHQAEGKVQARGGGGYSSDETPTRGGEMGCFVGHTMVRTAHGSIAIADIVNHKMRATVLTRAGHAEYWSSVSDWFHYRVDPAMLVEVWLADGRKLVCTRNHELILSDSQVVLAGDLKAGDELIEATDE
jgi:DNA-directed RNA polymerase beta subunit